MSTRCSIKYNRPENGPGYHLFDDALDHEADPPVYLELFGVEAEVNTAGYLRVTIPRSLALELGLLPADPSAAPIQSSVPKTSEKDGEVRNG